MTLDFTPQQKMAIEARGSALLVSAAAGSGKTKVLVERLLSYITNTDDPCDITEFLIITYTRAAASELKARILDELSERLTDDPGNRHLRRQSALCFEAPISTIHSFCTEIIRENAHFLSISPAFRVADESESGLIKDKVLEELLEARYEAIHETPGFSLLVDTMSAGRDDRRLKEIVIDAHGKLQSHEEPQRWIQEQLKKLELDVVADASETEWGSFLMVDVRKKAVYWYDVMVRLLEEMSTHPEFNKAYVDSVTVTADDLRRFARALEKSWDEAKACSDICFPRPKSVKGYEDLKDIRKKCRDAAKKLASVFECASAELLEDMRAVTPAVTELLKLVSDFDKEYALEKNKRGIIDFSDQEHMAAYLLTDRETGKPSELAFSVSKRYREIMVDEYQDCSRVQERLFSAISKNGKNVFMVGDVKQSIYRFRLADPSIFLSKYKSFADEPDADGTTGRRVLLSTNFRSRAGVLGAVNFIFKNIMSEEFGEMAYTEREYLYPGRNDVPCSEPAVELDVLDMRSLESEDEEESPEKGKIEAAFIADKIEELIGNGLEIPDGQGGVRPLSYGDIAILLRSVRDKAGYYAQALMKRNIPVSQPGGEGFFETLEVSVAISLLGVIDNPMQDVPLIAVLRSPVYGFTPDELAMIRLSDKRTDFYSALLKAAETNRKCAAFLDELGSFREIAPDLSADRLLWHVYNKTGLPGIMGALHGGEARRLNLMKLLELAGRYESNGYKGLFGFMTMIRHLMENGEGSGDTDGTPSGDTVKIMSIHKSKGLEFPVVILADTTKRFNKKDVLKPLLIHAQLGIGAKRTDLKRRIEYPTLARMSVSKKLTQEMLAEELRILYVAMTRAREKLIIVSTFADAEKELAKLQKDAAAPVSPQVMEGVTSLAGFILITALTRPDAGCLREGSPSVLSADDGQRWDIRKISAGTWGASGQSKIKPETEPARVKARIEDVEALREKLNFDYPYAEAAAIPSKLTATELKGRFADFEAAEDAEAPNFEKEQSSPIQRPSFITNKTFLTATERGTALHLAMQYIDYNRCQSIEGVMGELRRLKDGSYISGKQYESIDPVKISAFFESTLGKRVLGSKKLYREFKFSLLVKATEYYDGGGDEEILFQGVIDCCFVEEGALHIIDFKTDHVTLETAEQKKKVYTAQLTAYARAMERLTGLRVGSKILYFFKTGTATEI